MGQVIASYRYLQNLVNYVTGTFKIRVWFTKAKLVPTVISYCDDDWEHDEMKIN